MKIDFEDGGYIEISESNNDKIFVVVAAKNEDKTKTVNSAEITKDELSQLLSDIQLSAEPNKTTKTKPRSKTKKKPVEKVKNKKSSKLNKDDLASSDKLE